MIFRGAGRARHAPAIQRVVMSQLNGRSPMNRRCIICWPAIVALAFALWPATASAQQKVLKEQLVGTWTLVSFDSFDASGTKVPNMEGRDMKGLLVLTVNGRWSFQIITEIPKLASNDRLKTTPAEEKAVAHGVLSNFGTYSVNEGDKTIGIRFERSSFPNQVTGAEAKRVAVFSGDELKLDNPGRMAGGKTVTVWKREK